MKTEYLLIGAIIIGLVIYESNKISTAQAAATAQANSSETNLGAILPTVNNVLGGAGVQGAVGLAGSAINQAKGFLNGTLSPKPAANSGLGNGAVLGNGTDTSLQNWAISSLST